MGNDAGNFYAVTLVSVPAHSKSVFAECRSDSIGDPAQGGVVVFGVAILNVFVFYNSRGIFFEVGHSRNIGFSRLVLLPAGLQIHAAIEENGLDGVAFERWVCSRFKVNSSADLYDEFFQDVWAKIQIAIQHKAKNDESH